jgi:putative DNA primase/helicase
VLRGAIETPTLRPDGTLLTEPGYDIASQLYLDPGAVKFPAIAANPTREDAREALLAVLEPIKDFPFEPTEDERWGGQTASRSVALSAMLTGLVRASMATAPAHVIDAPVRGNCHGGHHRPHPDPDLLWLVSGRVPKAGLLGAL